MILAAVLLLAQSQSGPWDRYRADEGAHPNPFDQFDQKPERLGPGPYTLVISDRNAMTRIDYPTGAKCQKARDETRRQLAPPPSANGVIYGPSSVKAFCVPR